MGFGLINGRSRKSFNHLLKVSSFLIQNQQSTLTPIKSFQTKFYSSKGKQKEDLISIHSGSKENIKTTSHTTKENDKNTVTNPSSSHAHPASQSLKHSLRTSFFTPVSNSTSPFTSILQHCDNAIVLSRNSSDIRSLWSAREELNTAIRLYIDVIRTFSLRSDIELLSYETYLIRSGYAHVCRTIGALIGQDGAIICANLMKDYLAWELNLVKLEFRPSDGSARWIQEREKRKLKSQNKSTKQTREDAIRVFHEEELLRSGPFQHDMAPIIYDIFFDLTTSPVLNESGLRTGYVRMFFQIEHRELATELRLLIRQLPIQSWQQSLSPEWNRFRHPPSHGFRKQNSAVIDACVMMEANAQIRVSHYSTALEIWKNEVDYWKAFVDHTRTLLRLITVSFRTSVRRLNQISTTGGDMENKDVEIEIKALSSLFIDFCSTLCEDGILKFGRSTFITGSDEIKTILRNFFASIDLFENQKISRLIKEQDMEEITHSIKTFREWLRKCILQEEDESINIHLLRKLDIAGFNSILKRFMKDSELFGAASIEVALKLIEKMVKVDEIPHPDKVSMTILMGNAAKLKENGLIYWVLETSYNLLTEGQKKLEGSQNRIGFSALFVALLQDALKRNDGPRMIALLNIARLLKPRQSVIDYAQDGKIRKMNDRTDISAQTAIFTLYPSLSIRQSRWEWKEMNQLRIKKLQSFSLQRALRRSRPSNFPDWTRSYGRRVEFQPAVLVSALHLTAQKGLTGLTERLWRLWLRVVKSEQIRSEQLDVQNSKIKLPFATKMVRRYQSIIALTTLIRLYGREIFIARRRRQKDRKASNIRSRQSRLNLHSYNRQSRFVVRGWIRILTGPSANVQLLKGQGWMNDREMAARRMTQLRYFELRRLWLLREDGQDDLNSNLVKPLTISIQQIDPTIRPDQQFYQVLLANFRQDGQVKMPFDEDVLQNERGLIEFLHLVSNDMKAFHLKIPSDFDSLLSRF